MAAMEVRSKSLAKMLEEAIEDLRKVQNENSSDIVPRPLMEGIDLALAKVQFVKVHLDDSTIPLPVLDAVKTVASSASKHSGTNSPDDATDLPLEQQQSKQSMPPFSETEADASSLPELQEKTATVEQIRTRTKTPTLEPSEVKATAFPVRPVVNPIRSTLAQSSFAWMLESSKPSSSSSKTKSGLSQSASTFGSTGKRREGTKGNSKSAFLFGDSGDEGNLRGSRNGSQGENLEGFDLGQVGKGKDPCS
jgi:TBC1 domain family protein 5